MNHILIIIAFGFIFLGFICENYDQRFNTLESHDDALYADIKSLKYDIKESRQREEMLYKECKNLDYEISVLAGLDKNKGD